MVKLTKKVALVFVHFEFVAAGNVRLKFVSNFWGNTVSAIVVVFIEGVESLSVGLFAVVIE